MSNLSVPTSCFTATNGHPYRHPGISMFGPFVILTNLLGLSSRIYLVLAKESSSASRLTVLGVTSNYSGKCDTVRNLQAVIRTVQRYKTSLGRLQMLQQLWLHVLRGLDESHLLYLLRA
ncbi:hypothetical protein K491DRAFT_369232 [Lophiostoma macrostomum CBS 122681]|uniref:Uncharacterized protein n=1 Tax=Lophiostoma macrostomum CBS 122681 TaxID=1314788 RepID=A0A6A6T9X8_9PLEO|nr:hypothetical protein K491DRAFT_369232 [Lophiostoma macrostomum CBS 122681]